MASKIFIDANVLLDFTLKRDNYPVTRQLFSHIVAGKVAAFVTPSVIHITAYWLVKAYGNSKTKEILLGLLAHIKVIDTSHEIVLNAISSRMTDIEDALQYYTALHFQTDYFISEDKKLKKSAIASLPVFTVKEFLALL
ncbi:hypothetical protein A9P82_06255 [Arachidicoccus ginsenosidimutans]|uniref:type II toxin-antitoxin system VapC family toxin n=1 Tax=Arachidicoccus sp. BS20 TaxID=1850526 RepID=UPI0007F073AE|nr:PIN domain-containing protein [Arachidicoccus sp. BS20]ANI88931.1 hypothetical protein A9P82_06255 [Arachidicoccus sp. BS20]